MFPDPLGPISDDTETNDGFRDQASFFDLSERRRQLLIALHLMPAEEVNNPLSIYQVETKALSFAPLSLPTSSFSPFVLATRPTPFSALRTGGHISPINRQ